MPASEFRRGPIVTRGSIGPLALGVNPGTHESCKTGYPLRKILQVEYADSVLIEHAPLLFGRDSMPGLVAFDLAEGGRAIRLYRRSSVGTVTELVPFSPFMLLADRELVKDAPGLQEVLMDGVPEEEIGRARHVRRLAGQIAAAIASGEAIRPRPEARPPAQRARPFQRLDREEPGRVLHQLAVGEQHERRKWHELGDGRGTRAPVKPDRAAALGEIEGDEGGRGVPAEEERGVLDEH